MKKCVLTFCAAVCCWFAVHANHLLGADIEYKFSGKDTLTVTLRLYRDCNGIQVPLNPVLGLRTLNCTPAKTASVVMTQVSVAPVKLTCSSQKSLCENGSFPYGMEEHRYDATIYLQQVFAGGLDSNCCWLRALYEECCRNPAITNVNSNGPFYIEAEINRCIAPYNRSPVFTNNPLALILSGVPFWYNMGCVDSLDHDSLSYELADPLIGMDSPYTWSPPFSKDRPFQFLGYPNQNLPFPAGIHLDPVTGDFAATSTTSQQSDLAFKITEWRLVNGSYVKIGVTRRDVIFTSNAFTPNNSPQLEINGSSNGPWNFVTCAGTQFCITIKGRDKDSTATKRDSTRLTWNKGIPAASFLNINTTDSTKVIREDTAVFCWNPALRDVSTLPYYFTVTVSDNNCSVPGKTTRAIGMIVRSYPVSQGYIQQTALSAFARKLNFVRTDTNVSAVTYGWTVSNNPSGVFTTAGSATYNTQNFTHTFLQPGTYVVNLQLSQTGNYNYCAIVHWDTVKVCSFGITLGNDSNLCQGMNKLLQAARINLQGPPVNKYSWYRFDADAAKTDTLTDTTASIIALLSNTFSAYQKHTVKYMVTAIDSSLCFGTDTVSFTVNKPVVFNNPTHDAYTCAGTLKTLSFTPQINDSLLRYKWSNNKTGSVISEKDSGWYSIRCWNPDSSCVTPDSVMLHEVAWPTASAGNDVHLCNETPYTLNGTGGMMQEWFVQGQTNPQVSMVVNPAQTTSYVLRTVNAQNGTLCYARDTMTYFVGNKAALTLPSFGPICKTQGSVALTGQQPITGGTGMWTSSKPSCLNGNIFNTICSDSGTHQLYYTFITDTFGCVSTDSTILQVIASPQTQFSASTTTGNAPLQVTFTDNTISASGRVWNFGDPGSSSNTSVNASVAHIYQNTGTYTVKLITYTTAGSLNCHDTLIKTNYIHVTAVGIRQAENKNILVYPNPARNGFTIAAEQDNYTIQLFDMTGREVLHIQQNGSELEVERNNLPAGIYSVRITGSKNNQTFKGRVAFE